jgi:hypothetical protein
VSLYVSIHTHVYVYTYVHVLTHKHTHTCLTQNSHMMDVFSHMQLQGQHTSLTNRRFLCVLCVVGLIYFLHIQSPTFMHKHARMNRCIFVEGDVFQLPPIPLTFQVRTRVQLTTCSYLQVRICFTMTTW